MTNVVLLPFIAFFFNDTPTTEIYTLSLHDALPISRGSTRASGKRSEPTIPGVTGCPRPGARSFRSIRSEEHTSELQSRFDLVCRLLLEKKNIRNHFASPSRYQQHFSDDLFCIV